MKINYLFPNKYKRIGFLVLIPTFIIGIIFIFTGYTPDLLELKVPTIYTKELMGKEYFFSLIENNILDEILCSLIIISLLFIAFSKEKTEDELIYKIRLESLLWATYVNYSILLFSILFIYDWSFFWVIIINMFTLLFIFIIRFNYHILKFKKSAYNEE